MAPEIIFIVPYRDREIQRHFFSQYMNYIMEDYDSESYEIYYAHQMDKREFNRGGVKNIGFLAMKEKYPQDYKNITFVFNDVDTVPFKKNFLNFKTTTGKIKHFYGFKFCLGGIVSVTGQDFEKMNGYPNYWGWGFEDNTLQKRADFNKISIDRSHYYDIGDLHILQLFDSVYRKIGVQNRINSVIDNNSDGLTSLKNLSFKIDNNFINIESFNGMYDFNENNTAVLDLKTREIVNNKQNKKMGMTINSNNNVIAKKAFGNYKLNIGGGKRRSFKLF